MVGSKIKNEFLQFTSYNSLFTFDDCNHIAAK